MNNSIVEQFKNLIGKESNDSSPSPYGRWLNGKLLEAEEGKLVVSLEVRQDMTNPAGIMHGGVMAGFMDEIIGMACYTLGREAFYAALNINVDFLRPAKSGEIIIGKAEVIRAGKTVIYMGCEVYDTTNRLLARSVSNMIKTTF